MIAERVLMGLLIGGIALGCGFVLYPFFSAILWAAILAYTTWPVFAAIRARTHAPTFLVAALMVLLTTLVIVVPLALALPGGAGDIRAARLSLEAWLAGVPPAPHWLAELPLAGPMLAATWNAWAANLSGMAAAFRPYLGMFAERGLSLLLGVAGGFAQFFLALFVAFFLWLSGDRLGPRLQALVHRVAGHYGPDLILTTTRAVRGTVYGILFTAIVQGFLTAIGLTLAGVPRVFLLGTVAAFLAVLPVGAPVIWIPAGLWLLEEGHTGRGIFLLAYGVLVVSGADHIIRPYFIARGAQIPFPLTVLGVLGGVFAFGVLGIFLGPVLLGVGWMLVAQFARFEAARDQAAADGSGSTAA